MFRIREYDKKERTIRGLKTSYIESNVDGREKYGYFWIYRKISQKFRQQIYKAVEARWEIPKRCICTDYII